MASCNNCNGCNGNDCQYHELCNYNKSNLGVHIPWNIRQNMGHQTVPLWNMNDALVYSKVDGCVGPAGILHAYKPGPLGVCNQRYLDRQCDKRGCLAGHLV